MTPKTTKRDPAEAATVAWMLSLFATLMAEGLGLAFRILGIQSGLNAQLYTLSGTLLLCAALSGLILLLLTPLTLKLRKTRPPTPIVVTAVVAGLVPLVTIAILVAR